MKLYTKTGDQGTTGLYGGVRVPKDDLRVRVYGTTDELNSALGMLRARLDQKQSIVPEFARSSHFLLRVQNELFQIGTELATPRGREIGMVLLDQQAVESMEQEIDHYDGTLPALKSFILPGGSEESALAHFCRTVTRRAERELASLHRGEAQRPEVLQYLNRLSDYLFILARALNHAQEMPDTPWLAPQKGPNP